MSDHPSGAIEIDDDGMTVDAVKLRKWREEFYKDREWKNGNAPLQPLWIVVRHSNGRLIVVPNDEITGATGDWCLRHANDGEFGPLPPTA